MTPVAEPVVIENTEENWTPVAVPMVGEVSTEPKPASKRATTEGRPELPKGIDWPTMLWIVFLHAGALAAPFTFTWKGLALAGALAWLTGSLGICLGYHRLLTHNGFRTYRWLRRTFGVLGLLAGEGAPAQWVAVHRKHHQFSDQDHDPHSPRHGGWWSHVLWLSPNYGQKYQKDMQERFAPDILRDPLFRFMNPTFVLWHWALGTVLFLTGWLAWDLQTGASFVVYGVFVRLIYVLHVTWFVNSASHIWGYRNYETTDDSRNLWWVGLLAFGEGWHNNHHAYQRLARHGHKWWEFDATYAFIKLLEKVGLVWDVQDQIPKPAAKTAQ